MRILKYLLLFFLIIVILPVVAYITGTVYFVPEYKNAVVTRFGEVQYAVLTGFQAEERAGVGLPEVEEVSPVIEFTFDDIKERYSPGQIRQGAGLYWKIPFIEQVHFFDSRILIWEGREHEVSTNDLRTLILEPNARWRIIDPVRFYEALGDEQHALTRIESAITGNIEDLISESSLIEIVRYLNLELGEEVEDVLEGVEGEEEVESAARLRYGRGELIEKIEQESADSLLDNFGVQLVDVLFTRLNYPESVQENVFARMKAERNRIAERYEAQGERIKRQISGEVRRRENEMLSDAQRQVEEILGGAEARATELWAAAQQQDPDFYRFRRSLNAYARALGSNTIFILSDDNSLLEFVTGPGEIESAP